MPTLFKSFLTKAQKQPCEFRYSGQIPGCMTKVPRAGMENTLSFNNILQRAIMISGLVFRMNSSVSGEFGWAV